MLSEQELISGCKKGKPRYQEALYKHFYAFAMSVCLRYTQQREDALEILNDSFMKVFKNIGQFDTNRPFKTWFRRILINTALDHYRSNRKYKLYIETSDETQETPVDPDFFVQLDAEEILSLFREIPDIQRIIFNLYEVEGYSHDEIAGLLDIAPGTSRSHLSRAKKKLESLYLQKIIRRKNHEII